MTTPYLPDFAWTIDPAHSQIQFKIKHLVVATVTGAFRSFRGSLTPTAPDTLAGAAIEFALDVASLDTHNAQRDAHLTGPDLFDAAQFPHIRFRSTHFAPSGPDGAYALLGELTIRDVTRPIELTVSYGGSTSFRGVERAGFEVSGRLRRADFGLTWNLLSETGTLVVGEEVRLLLDVELMRPVASTGS